MPPALWALAAAAFAIGTSEFVVTGLLPAMARDLAIDLPTAGHIVGVYSLGVLFGSPPLAIALARTPPRTALMLMMAVFTAGNLACALAPNYETLLAARILAAIPHGAFFGVASVTAARLVPAGQRGRAVSLMFTGLTVANILGVPAGTALGEAFGWRTAFAAILPVGGLSLLALWRLVPATPSTAGRLLGELAGLRGGRVWAAMACSSLFAVSLLSLFAYIAPWLIAVAHIPEPWVAAVLIAIGAGITIGMMSGGRLIDRFPRRAVPALMLAIAAGFTLMALAAPHPGLAMAAILAWSIVAFSPGAGLQITVVEAASGAPTLASTLNQSAFHLGNFCGAWLGGAALAAGIGLQRLPWVAAIMALVAAALAALVNRGTKR